MTLESRLAEELMRTQPARAAAVLERLPVEQAAAVLAELPAAHTAPVLAALSVLVAAAVIERCKPTVAAAMIHAIPDDSASRILRRVAEAPRAAVFAELSARESRTFQTLLQFPENSAGALMDPDVLALPDDLTASQALTVVRELPDQARYNIYIVDRAHVLVGAVNLREMMLAASDTLLSQIMVPNPYRIEAHVDRDGIASHPGWKHVHALPVVDEFGCYIGSVRYRTLRQLEEELLVATQTDANATEALGDVFASGAAGIFEAITSRAPEHGARWK